MINFFLLCSDLSFKLMYTVHMLGIHFVDLLLMLHLKIVDILSQLFIAFEHILNIGVLSFESVNSLLDDQAILVLPILLSFIFLICFHLEVSILFQKHFCPILSLINQDFVVDVCFFDFGFGFVITKEIK